MNFQIKILLVAFGVALLLGIIILPILRKLKVSQQERAEGPKSHLNKKGTPHLSGVPAVRNHGTRCQRVLICHVKK